jgi:hypothetical protein
MYHSSDPRAALATAAAKPSTAAEFAGAEYGRFYSDPPVEQSASGKTWMTRGQNFLVAYTEANAGASLARAGQPDEYVLLLPKPGAPVIVEWNGQSVEVPANTITFVPAGDSVVRATEPGEIVRIFTTQADDLAALCANADSYAEPHPNVALLSPWPEPNGGKRLRTYSLDVAPQPGRFGRIFRGSSLMVNILEPRQGMRDPTKMSPHHHDDFEQGSLALAGSFTHYIRWPWTPNMSQWRPDEAEICAAPSLCVIPPPAIHTSQSTDPVNNQLIDIFCPPRLDFSSKPGWVLNADDYPMPQA